jgi:hypothetical protein
MLCMSTTMAFTVVLTDVEGGWTQAQLRELPSVITCAPSAPEAREAVVDALREYLASFTQPAVEPPAASTTSLVRVVIDAA